MLLFLSFAEQKVISSNYRTHNLVASGIFIQDCMIVKSAKTETKSNFNKLVATFLLSSKVDNKSVKEIPSYENATVDK